MPLSPAVQGELKQLYNALSDRVLLPDDPRYVREVNAREGAPDVIEEIAREIEWQEGGGVSLFTGQRGTGKSTELKRLERRLNDAGMTAFYADLAEYLLLTKEVEISDFLVALAGAMSDRVQEYCGKAPDNRSYWERFRALLARVEVKEFGAKVEPSAFGTKLGTLDIKAALKNDPDFKRRVQEAARGHVAQIVRDAHDFMIECVLLVREKVGNPDRKVVLLVDSVERIRGVGSEAMSVYESVRNLFFGHAEHLRIPSLHIVYTIPPYLSILAPGASTLMGGVGARRLVSTHIFKDRSRKPDPEGLQVLSRVVAVRYAGWDKILTQEALDRLALSSGGDLREFFRLVRLCLPAVRDDKQLPLDVDSVKPAENLVRNEMLPIPADQLAWLRRISSTHDTCLEKDVDLPILAHFLDNRLVLNYRNGQDWYDVHPLLREVIDKDVPVS